MVLSGFKQKIGNVILNVIMNVILNVILNAKIIETWLEVIK